MDKVTIDGWFAHWPTENGEYHWVYTWDCGCCISRHGLVIIADIDDYEDNSSGIEYTDINSKKHIAFFEHPLNPYVDKDGDVIISAFKKWEEPDREFTQDRDWNKKLLYPKADRVGEKYEYWIK